MNGAYPTAYHSVSGAPETGLDGQQRREGSVLQEEENAHFVSLMPTGFPVN